MNLVSITPGFFTRMRVYACHPGKKPQRSFDWQFDRVPTVDEVALALTDPKRFLAEEVGPEPEAA